MNKKLKIVGVVLFLFLVGTILVLSERLPFRGETNWNVAFEKLWNVSHTGNGTIKIGLNQSFEDLNVTGTLLAQDLNITNKFFAKHYLSTGGMLFNFYDDGSELFLNMTYIMDAFNIEMDNTKLALYNNPAAGNDYKVFQLFSKEAQDVTEFIVYKAAAGRSALFSRSLRIGGPTSSDCTVLDTRDMVACDTDVTGADLIVQDELVVLGAAFFVNGSINFTDAGNIVTNGSIFVTDKVGIGTTTPLNKLDIAGNVTSRGGNMTVGSPTDPTNQTWFDINGVSWNCGVDVGGGFTCS